MTIEIDVDRCIGGGQCVLAAPELFDQDELDGTVVLLRQPEASEPREEEGALEAERFCPARVIHVVRDEPRT